MQESSILPFEQRPIVVLVADPSAMAVSLVENFVANLCRVRVVSNKVGGWKGFIKHLGKNRAIEITKRSLKNLDRDFNYLIFLHTDEEEIKNQKEFLKKKSHLELALETSEEWATRTLVVLPYLQGQYEQRFHSMALNTLRKGVSTLGIVCLGELFGPRMSKRSIAIAGQEEELYLTYVNDAAKELVKSLFSFGSAGEVVFIFSERISVSKFVELLRVSGQETALFTEKRPGRFVRPAINRYISLRTNLKKALKETIDWFAQSKVPVETDFKKSEIKKLKKTKAQLPKVRLRSDKWLWGFLLLLAVLLINPVLLIASSSSLFIASKQVASGNLSSAKVFFSFSSLSSSLVYKEGEMLSLEPLRFTSSLLQKLAHLGRRAVLVSEYSSGLVQKMLGDESYDPSAYSQKMALELDYIYRETGFLQSEFENETGVSKKIANIFVNYIDLTEVREKVFIGKKIALSLPAILGNKEPVTYLVLFQNNMELRPTGGFIGSFALVTFEKGRLVEMSVSDVYTADGQLKGYIEPPSPIKEYLGEASWFLRDSNWDPDFPTSATTAEWFLEKEIDKKVDGVIAIDLEMAKKLIAETGPIYLSDFEKLIDENNLYEITQEEVEKNFFPGSQKKSSFLTALSRELLVELVDLPSEEFFGVGKAVLNGLEEKHVQIFLHQKDAQRAFADAGWDGGVYQPSCSGNCFSDWLGIIDANVGVNKVNYFLDRQASLTITLEEGMSKRRLTVLLNNRANPALGDEMKYKSYLRVLVPQESFFSSVEIFDSTNREFVIPETRERRGRKEAGVLVEVPPGHSKSITFTWQEESDLSFNEPGEYRLYWRKQAGTMADPISIKFVLPDPSLTIGGQLEYNTTLARDFSSRIFW